MSDTNEIKLSYNDVIEKLENGDYEPEVVLIPKKLASDHIFDEDLSVKQNRQMLEDYNNMRCDKIKLNRQKANEADKRFETDLASALVNDYSLNQAQAAKIVAVAYDAEHSEGRHHVAHTAREIAELYRELWKLQKVK